MRMASGRMIRTTALGLKPVIMRVKTMRTDAMELREAKKPFVVENKPMRARAKIGREIRGERKTLSIVLCQEKTGARPVPILLQ